MPDVYLDVCCLNRPYDDQTQERIRLEAEAVQMILRRIDIGDWRLTSSEAVVLEIDQTRDPERRTRLRVMLRRSYREQVIDAEQTQRAEQLERLGFDFGDALHIACAESAAVDILLTTDDGLLKRAMRGREQLLVRVANPAAWLMEEKET